MALFVIVSGLLLILGGGASLVLGFDIVMTERGSAMTLGGVIALSGGVIAVGIGAALRRLRQILRALEARAPRSPRVGSPDRPVVPLHVEPAADSHGLAAAAGAGALGALALDTRGRAEDPAPVAEAPVAAPPLLRPVDMEATDERAFAPLPPPATPAIPDLEDELSRALAEIDEPAQPRRSFADGLSDYHDREAGEREAEDVRDAPPAEESPIDPPRAEASMALDRRALAMPEDAAEAPAEASTPTEVEPAEAPAAELPPSGDPGGEPPRAKPEVLGSYSVGGRTYRMFSDGTVEAETESGIERFASMDDLRRHLAAS